MRRTIIAGSVIAGTLTLALAVPALGAGIGYAAAAGSAVNTCDGTGTGSGGPGSSAGTGNRGPQAGNGTGTADRGPGMGRGSGSGAGGAGTGSGAGAGGGQGMPGMGSGGRGQGAGRGTGGPGTATTTGTLTSAQRAELSAMAEEEKLAGDLYAVLGAEFADAELTTIAASEDRHLVSVQRLLARYGIPDPTVDQGVGEFLSTPVQELYDELLARGDDSLEAAYQVGVEVEEMDIADLTEALTGLTAPDVTRVYTNLRAASQHHLVAFSS